MAPDLLAQKELIYKNETYNIIGAAMDVHRYLGRGFLEAVYHEALLIELKNRNIPYKSEIELNIDYKGIVLSKKYYADIVCYDKIINYLKATRHKLGLLINFGTENLTYKRFAN